MKRILILFATLLVALSTLAQTNTRVKEAGVVYSGRNRFGFTYRFGSEHALWRVNLISVTYTEVDTNWPPDFREGNSRDYGLEFGREFRSEIAPYLAFRYGADLTFTYGKSASNSLYNLPLIEPFTYHYMSERYVPGIQLVLGLCYTINKVVVGAEILPIIQYRISTFDSQSNSVAKHQNQSSLIFWMDSKLVELSVAYRL